MTDAMDDPAAIPAPASYHWTPALQRDFLEHVAGTGSVRIAASRVGMSPSAAYQLRQRAEGAAFRLGWAAAVLLARGRLADELLDRAIFGHEETTIIMREEGRASSSAAAATRGSASRCSRGSKRQGRMGQRCR
ncbi:hypothetical protein [Sphingopyxis sp. PET50]|uniref:hypothetical protein n=1 Tax=Sphingopyxis sp. PET50 TaxID=2976533 RepID=UPI0021B05403|nr:hypothetical protein [Sphingopyxis sp. PET50]